MHLPTSRRLSNAVATDGGAVETLASAAGSEATSARSSAPPAATAASSRVRKPSPLSSSSSFSDSTSNSTSSTATAAPISPSPPMLTVNDGPLPAGSHAPSQRSARKGKERQRESDLVPLSRSGWTQWVVDPHEAHRGAEVWTRSERVILVMGEPTIAGLAPLLYSPAFMHTLLLVASIRQLPEIEALASPSHLMSLGDSRTIYPTIQPVHLPPDSLQAGKHPLHLLLKQATQLAEAHRGGGMGAALGVGGSPPAGRPLSWMSRGRERRGSGSSASDSNWMTMNPADRATKWFTFGRRSNGSSPTGSQLDLPLPGLRAAGAQSNPRPMSVMSTATTASRASGMGMGGRDKKRQDTPSEGSPFDAVINLIPSAPSTDQRQALTKMLQHTTVLTTAVLPILTAPPSAKSVTATAPVMDLPPLSVIHVVPADAPPALAPVIERFLAPLLPLMGARTRRPFFGCVTGYRQWRSSTISTAEDSLPGAETLLFGGVSSATGDETLRQQALLGSWEQCAIAPGALDVAHRAKPAEFSSRASAQALGEARANTSTGRAPLPHTRSMPLLREEERTRSRPAVSPLASGRSSTNSNSNSRNAASPLSPISYTPTAPRSPSGLRYAVQPSPPTPELDASSSSCSSASLEPPPETESQPAQQPRIAQAATAPMPMPTPSPPVDKVKEKRGFGAMFRRARGIKA